MITPDLNKKRGEILTAIMSMLKKKKESFLYIHALLKRMCGDEGAIWRMEVENLIKKNPCWQGVGRESGRKIGKIKEVDLYAFCDEIMRALSRLNGDALDSVSMLLERMRGGKSDRWQKKLSEFLRRRHCWKEIKIFPVILKRPKIKFLERESKPILVTIESLGLKGEELKLSEVYSRVLELGLDFMPTAKFDHFKSEIKLESGKHLVKELFFLDRNTYVIGAGMVGDPNLSAIILESMGKVHYRVKNAAAHEFRLGGDDILLLISLNPKNDLSR